MPRTISVVNQKGGVGKTATVVNVGAALAELGHNVLVVDFDSGRGLSMYLGLLQAEHTIEKAMFEREGDRERYLHPTCVERLSAVPAGQDLAGAELALASELNRERFLARALRPWKDRFDFILIDNSPSLGLLAINALVASDSVLVPVQCQYMALAALAPLMDTIAKVRDHELQPQLEILGILPTMFNPSMKQSAETVERLREEFGDKVLRSIIRIRSQFAYAPVAAQPVTVFDPKSDAAEMYRNVARELTGMPIVEAVPASSVASPAPTTAISA